MGFDTFGSEACCGATASPLVFAVSCVRLGLDCCDRWGGTQTRRHTSGGSVVVFFFSSNCCILCLWGGSVVKKKESFKMSSVVGGDDSSSSPQLGTGSSADNDESDVKDDKAVKNNSAQAGKSERKKKKKKKKKKRSKKSKSDKKQDPQTNLPAKAEAASAEANGSTGQSAQAKPGDGGLEELLRRSGVGVGGASHHPEGKSVPPSSADSTAPSAHNASTPSATRGAGIAAAALVSSFQRSQSHQQLIKLKDVLRKQFTCALCRDLLYKPVTTPCGHSFCQACLLHMAATGGNLVAAATGAPGSAEAAVRDESSYSGILKDFKCPMCRTELPGCVAQTGVSVALWDAVNAVFKGYAWQRRSEHEAELAHARALPVGAWATYYRQRIGAIVDRIEEGREVHGSFDGHDNSTASGEAATDNLNSNRMNRRVIKEQRDGRVVCQEVRVHPDDRFRRHAVAFVRFPRADILVRASRNVHMPIRTSDLPWCNFDPCLQYFGLLSLRNRSENPFLSRFVDVLGSRTARWRVLLASFAFTLNTNVFVGCKRLPATQVGLLDMDEDEADDEVPLMVAGDDTALLANTRDSVAMVCLYCQSAGVKFDSHWWFLTCVLDPCC